MHEYRRILAVVDFDDHAAPVVQRAMKLARLERAELILLHLIEPDAALDGGYPVPSRKATGQALEAAALRRLAFLAAHLRADEARLISRCGSAAESFSSCIHEWQPDLVVAETDPGFLAGQHDLLTLGRSRRGGKLQRWLRTWLIPSGLSFGR